jgi:hypothetical protein
MEKVSLKVVIDREIAEGIKTLALIKRKRFRGGLSEEVEEALAYWLEINQEKLDLKNIISTHTHMHNFQLKQASSTGNKNREKVEQIIKYIKEQGIENEFTINHWKNACIKAGYNDYRTIDKYLNVAMELGIIANVRPGIFKITG